MNRTFKRKLVFVKVCSPFSFIRVTNAEKIKKKRKKRKRRPQEPVLSPRFTNPRFTSPVQSSPVQSSPVHAIQYAFRSLSQILQTSVKAGTAQGVGLGWGGLSPPQLFWLLMLEH